MAINTQSEQANVMCFALENFAPFFQQDFCSIGNLDKGSFSLPYGEKKKCCSKGSSYRLGHMSRNVSCPKHKASIFCSSSTSDPWSLTDSQVRL